MRRIKISKQQSIILDRAYNPKAGDVYVERYGRRKSIARVVSVTRRLVRVWTDSKSFPNQVRTFQRIDFAFSVQRWMMEEPGFIYGRSIYTTRRK